MQHTSPPLPPGEWFSEFQNPLPGFCPPGFCFPWVSGFRLHRVLSASTSSTTTTSSCALGIRCYTDRIVWDFTEVFIGAPHADKLPNKLQAISPELLGWSKNTLTDSTLNSHPGQSWARVATLRFPLLFVHSWMVAPGRGVGCMGAVGNGMQGPLVFYLQSFLCVMLQGQHTAMHRKHSNWTGWWGYEHQACPMHLRSRAHREKCPLWLPTKRIINTQKHVESFALLFSFPGTCGSGTTCCFEDNSSQLVWRVLRVLWFVGASQTCNATLWELISTRYLVGYGPDSAQGCFYCVFPLRDRHVDINPMLPLRSNVHLNNAMLETCGILALFLGSWCRMHYGTTALGFFKRLGKFSVVIWNGFAAKLQPLGFPNPSTVLMKGWTTLGPLSLCPVFSDLCCCHLCTWMCFFFLRCLQCGIPFATLLDRRS